MSPRDPEGTRTALLDAAEALFAGQDARDVTLAAVGAAAGLSRGAAGYVFGSKEALRLAVLERAFARRDSATERAMAPLRAWTADGDLLDATARAAAGYLRFLQGDAAFVLLVQRAALPGGGGLEGVPRASRAVRDAFGAAHDACRAQGLAAPDPDLATQLFVALCFFPVAHEATFRAGPGRRPAALRRYARAVARAVLAGAGADG